jgi:hypothetical protein
MLHVREKNVSDAREGKGEVERKRERERERE